MGRRVLAVLLAVALCWTVPVAAPVQRAYAYTAGEYTDAHGVTWNYSVENGEATIESLSGSGPDDLIIPATITDDSGTYPVVEIAVGAQAVGWESTTIPASVRLVGAAALCAGHDIELYFLGDVPEFGENASSWDDVLMNDASTFYYLEKYPDWANIDAYSSLVLTYEAPESVAIRINGADADTAEVTAGGTLTLSAENLPASSQYKSFHTALTWSSSNANVAVSNSGVVSVGEAVAGGTQSVITATNAIGQSDSITVTVAGASEGKTDIAEGCTYSPSEIGEVYVNGGSPHIPQVAVTETATNNPLVLGTDYTVSYAQADGTALEAAPTTTGSYNMVFQGIGDNFEGTYSMAFRLVDYLTVAGWQYRPDSDGTTASIVGYEDAQAIPASESQQPLVVPAYIDGLEVTSIEANALASVPYATVVVPDTVDKVGTGALASASTSTVRFMGKAPTFDDPSATVSAGAAIEVFDDLKAGYANALGASANIVSASQPWTYFVELAADGTQRGVLGATGGGVCYRGSSDATADLVLPESIDGVALNVLGEYCLYGDLQGLQFNTVTVPACYDEVRDYALYDLAAVVVFQGAAPASTGSGIVYTSTDDIELWYPDSQAASWDQASWADPNGAYDEDWSVKLVDGSPVIVGYSGTSETIEVPSSYFGRTITSVSGLQASAAGATSVVVPASVTSIEGTMFTDLACDITFRGAPPVCDVVDQVLKGADGAAYAGTVKFPKSYESEWAASAWASTYTCEGMVACVPEDFTYQAVEGGLAVTGYTGSDLDIEIPSQVSVTVDGVSYEGTVVAIAEDAFREGALTGVVVPATVTSIANGAFWRCSSLRYVELSEGLKSIGDDVFWYCTSLEQLNLPASIETIGSQPFISSALKEINVAEGCATFASADGVLFNADYTTLVCYPMGRTQQTYTVPDTVTTIGRAAFRGEWNDYDNALSEVVFPDGLNKICWAAFRNAEGLTKVEIPDSVTELETYIFDSCGKLESVKFPAGCTEIPEGILSFASSVTSITIPEGVRSIGATAFQTTSITEIVLPEGLEEIGSQAFDGCSSLVSVTLPSTLTVVGDHAFNGCRSVESLDLTTASITTIGIGSFAGMRSLKSIVIPNTVTSMGNAAFMEDSALASVQFEAPCQLTTVPSQAFAWCPLTEIVVPASVTAVEYWAFYQCSALERVVFQNQGEWTLDSTAFANASSGIDAYGYTASSTKANAEGIGYTFKPIDMTIVSDLPQTTEAKQGDSVTLRVVAAAENGTLGYAWYCDDVLIGGADSDTYTFTADAAGLKTYRVEVHNSFDPEHPVTSTGTVRVTADEEDPEKSFTVAQLPDMAYTGKALTPKPTVTSEDGQELVEGQDYTLSYSDNIQPGTATVTVAGMGEYAGTVTVTFNIVAAEAEFTDVPDDAWYAGMVKEAARLGIVTGYRDDQGQLTGRFGPEDQVTRAQIAMMLSRAMHVDVDEWASSELPFTDVPSDAVYVNTLKWAYSIGLLLGDGDRVRPDDPATREEIAAIAMRYAKINGLDTANPSPDAFIATDDWRDTSDWAVESCTWAADFGLMTGYVMDDGTLVLDPTGNATRAQMAKIAVLLATSID